jgi:hypothetical protein
MKRILILITTMMMLLTIATPAFAAESILDSLEGTNVSVEANGKTYDITISDGEVVVTDDNGEVASVTVTNEDGTEVTKEEVLLEVQEEVVPSLIDRAYNYILALLPENDVDPVVAFILMLISLVAGKFLGQWRQMKVSGNTEIMLQSKIEELEYELNGKDNVIVEDI